MKYPFPDNSHSLWLQNPTTHVYPELTDSDPFGVDAFATHHMPLEEAPEAYEMFQKKEQGAVKVVLHPQIS